MLGGGPLGKGSGVGGNLDEGETGVLVCAAGLQVCGGPGRATLPSSSPNAQPGPLLVSVSR